MADNSFTNCNVKPGGNDNAGAMGGVGETDAESHVYGQKVEVRTARHFPFTQFPAHSCARRHTRQGQCGAESVDER